jgi:hypothetical protein
MFMIFQRILPSKLSSKQKEAYHFQKISAVLADYGFQTIRLSDDWCGADFIAQHLNGSFLKVQLKGRLTVNKKYEGKDLWICFPYQEAWYIYPHDEILDILLNKKYNSIVNTYKKLGIYHFPSLSNEIINILNRFKID